MSNISPDDTSDKGIAPEPYPSDREQFFAHRATRLLLKCGVCQELGADAFALLVHVVHTEDVVRYRRAVTFWNDDLMQTLGMSRAKLVRVRKESVDAGWLHYEAGRKGVVGRYWLTVPQSAQMLDVDHEEDESSLDAVQNQNGIETRTGRKPRIKLNDNRAPFLPNTLNTPSALNTQEGEEALSQHTTEFVDAWNESEFSHCRKLTPDRVRALNARLRDADWRVSWPDALSRIRKSAFCCGENDRGWKADIDWFLQPGTLTKILEGKYDNRNGNSRTDRHRIPVGPGQVFDGEAVSPEDVVNSF